MSGHLYAYLCVPRGFDVNNGGGVPGERPAYGRVWGRSPLVEDMRSEVRDAYSRRAAEYAAHLGSMEAVHSADRQP